ncbi:thiol reductant ABC exporter subunit CydD [Microbacterium sp. ASV49]|uniref:Thiol reductant ABC exporter subunit CydD n=1 Tax=Microbacterium candidum TaxID=3041922 RepID=A0ABT7N2I3_9MICO|nr:thiol reductant ABC exporter subunit CydD [Microbacterium sp. ASV49]MDL9980931.1 thiol reductant ABC exporter subunit CydD [Microbacterium sp. ASV49]
MRGPVDPRLLRVASASRAFLLASAGITVIQTAILVGFAWLLTRALVGAIDGEPVARLWPFVGLALLLVLARGALAALAERVSARGAAQASRQLRSALVDAVGRLGPGWLARRNAASIALTAGHGLEALDAYFGRYLPQLVATVITMPVVVVAIFAADPVSGLIVLVTLPLIPLFMVLIGLATRSVQRRQFDTLTQLAARFADTVGGLGTLKVFGREWRAAASIGDVTRRYARETMSVLRVSFLSGFALEFLASISVAIVAVTIGLRLLDGGLDLTIGLFVLLLAPEAYLPLRQVGVQFHAAAEGAAATDDIFEVLDAAREAPVRDSVVRGVSEGVLLAAQGLEIRRGPHLIGPIDLAVSAGRIVLLEGPSGAGKSSVLAALLGFVEYRGTVETSAASARDAIAWSGQRPGLVEGSVLENIALGAVRPDEELAAQCLRDAQASRIPLDRALGPGGAGLSGGQAQRVAVARALYRLRSTAACVLVLDEPSSALDAEIEAALWRTLRAVAEDGAGVLLVSHRTSARAIADEIVRMPPARVEAAA